MKIIASADRAFKAAVKKVVSRSSIQGDKVEGTVRSILKAVERGGDAAVSRYTHKFDRVSIKPEAFRVTPDQMQQIHVNVDSLRRIHPARRDSIYNGADDDGSGTTAALEIAEAFAGARVKPKRARSDALVETAPPRGDP